MSKCSDGFGMNFDDPNFGVDATAGESLILTLASVSLDVPVEDAEKNDSAVVPSSSADAADDVVTPCRSRVAAIIDDSSMSDSCLTVNSCSSPKNSPPVASGVHQMLPHQHVKFTPPILKCPRCTTPPESPVTHDCAVHRSSHRQPPPLAPTVTSGHRCKLLHEGNIQLCRLNHTRTIVSKIMNSKYLRRWESHYLILGISEIRSAEVRFLFFWCRFSHIFGFVR